MRLRDFAKKYENKLNVGERAIYYQVNVYRKELIDAGIIRPVSKLSRVFYEVVDEEKLYEFLEQVRELAKMKARLVCV